MKKSTIHAAAATSAPFRHLKVEHGIVERNKRFVLLEQEDNSEAPTSTSSSVASSFNSPARGHLFTKSLIDELHFVFLQ